ncbi:Hypothetical protein BROD_3076 [Brucella sp. NF 2653]|nr:Hypothetical protein BROD_3076 [Brucella sp. NF 2653]
MIQGKACQTCGPAQTAYLALIETIVVQLSIAIDLAAFLPRFQEKIGLPFVLASSPAQRVL